MGDFAKDSFEFPRSDEITYSQAYEDGPVMPWPSEAFMQLDLSPRAYNSLCRGKCLTVSDLVNHIRKGDLIKFRNIGRKLLEEIMKKVSDYVGYDCWDIWGADDKDNSSAISTEELVEFMNRY